MIWGPGKLLFIHIAEQASSNMKELKEATLVEGKGIIGDRYYNKTGKYSSIPDIREITIIENEVLKCFHQIVSRPHLRVLEILKIFYLRF